MDTKRAHLGAYKKALEACNKKAPVGAYKKNSSEKLIIKNLSEQKRAPVGAYKRAPIGAYKKISY